MYKDGHDKRKECTGNGHNMEEECTWTDIKSDGNVQGAGNKWERNEVCKMKFAEQLTRTFEVLVRFPLILVTLSTS